MDDSTQRDNSKSETKKRNQNAEETGLEPPSKVRKLDPSPLFSQKTSWNKKFNASQSDIDSSKTEESIQNRPPKFFERAAPINLFPPKDPKKQQTSKDNLPIRMISEGVNVEAALNRIIGDSSQQHFQPSKASDQTTPSVSFVESVVIDACNVSYEHGKGQWSTNGLPIVVRYFESLGIPVISFLPDHYLQCKYPDPMQDWSEMESLVQRQVLFLTPAADYDDLYIIKHAQKHHAVIISNDKYRDVPLKLEDVNSQAELSNWIKEHVIHFKFKQNEFIPKSYQWNHLQFKLSKSNKTNKKEQ